MTFFHLLPAPYLEGLDGKCRVEQKHLTGESRERATGNFSLHVNHGNLNTSVLLKQPLYPDTNKHA